MTGDALTFAVNALGMSNVVAAEAAVQRHRTVGAYQLHYDTRITTATLYRYRPTIHTTQFYADCALRCFHGRFNETSRIKVETSRVAKDSCKTK